MSSPVTIIAYHYVRDLARSRFPAIKGRDLTDFRGQIQYLQSHYTFITAEALLAAIYEEQTTLPPNAAVLTFDDGYIDHFQCVFPILHDLGIQGSFFPAAQAIAERRVLDVNKIHFLLAAAPSHQRLFDDLCAQLHANRDEFGLLSNETYFRRFARPGRFDPPAVMFIKRLLQRGLPERLRHRITDDLFRRYVTMDEEAFASELYLSMDQVRCMIQQGMYVGSHGYGHHWMDTLSPDEQADDLDRSLRFLAAVGHNGRDLIMCYPYGGYDAALIATLQRKGFRAALTTREALAFPTRRTAFELPRLDTNALPTSPRTAPPAWTLQTADGAALAA